MPGDRISCDSVSQRGTLSLGELDFIPNPESRLTDGRWNDTHAAHSDGNRWISQARRRASILATARLLFARNGYDRFHVRELAGLCGVSAQTIYNLIGDKEQVLHEATWEHVHAMVTSATQQSHRYPNTVLALGDIFCATAAKYPDYARQMAISFNCSTRPLFDVISNCTVPLLFSALTRLQLRHQLRECVDPRIATERIAVLGAISMLHWADGRRSAREFRQDVGLGLGLVLLGAVETREQPRIEEWLISLEAAHSREALA